MDSFQQSTVVSCQPNTLKLIDRKGIGNLVDATTGKIRLPFTQAIQDSFTCIELASPVFAFRTHVKYFEFGSRMNAPAG